MSILGFCSLATLTMLATASKCPGPRKPHATNCTLYYDCVDLPNGQHAWLPTKCDDGLIFEPYLGTCVVPEDSRSCVQNSKIVTKSNRKRPSVIENQLVSSRNVTAAINVLDEDESLDKCQNIATPNSFPDTKLSPEYCNDIIQRCFSSETPVQNEDNDAKLDETKISENSIISITNNLGNKQYISVRKYSALKDKLTSETVLAVSCIDGIRLPNDTDCSKYYTCDSKATTVAEFSCPVNTAFNEERRKCDTRSYELCRKGKTLEGEISSCSSPGKIADPSSNKHYYFCYSSDDDTVRLSCPAHLIFCQKTSTCTTEYLCRRSQK